MGAAGYLLLIFRKRRLNYFHDTFGAGLNTALNHTDLKNTAILTE